MRAQLTDQELWNIRAVNTHCHHLTKAYFSHVSLHQLLQMTYVSWIMPDPGDTVQGHEKYFEEMEANSYFRWWRGAIETLYGDGRRLTPESWDWFDGQVRQAYETEGHDIGLLRDVCRYDGILLDDYQAPGSDHQLPGLMNPIFRCDMFLCGYVPSRTDENHNHAYDYFPRRPASLEEYVQATQGAIEAAVQRGAVGLKIAIAYERTLEFTPDCRSLAEQAFGNPEASPLHRKAFGDYMMFEIARIAHACAVPIQIHTGLGGLSGSRAIGLRDLIAANPDTKFDLFHGSYPWCDDVLGLAHNYANVYVDLCWLPLISTTRSVAFLREALELVNAGRILWGCDTWTSEESYGARMAAHQCILSTLNPWIEEGVLSYETAQRYARRILRDNAAGLYGLTG